MSDLIHAGSGSHPHHRRAVYELRKQVTRGCRLHTAVTNSLTLPVYTASGTINYIAAGVNGGGAVIGCQFDLEIYASHVHKRLCKPDFLPIHEGT